MHKFLIATAAALALGTAASAYASNDSDVVCSTEAGAQWMSVEDVAASIRAQGYDVREVERDDGCYELEAIAADGGEVELYVNPVTGEIVGTEHES